MGISTAGSFFAKLHIDDIAGQGLDFFGGGLAAGDGFAAGVGAAVDGGVGFFCHVEMSC